MAYIWSQKFSYAICSSECRSPLSVVVQFVQFFWCLRVEIKEKCKFNWPWGEILLFHNSDDLRNLSWLMKGGSSSKLLLSLFRPFPGHFLEFSDIQRIIILSRINETKEVFVKFVRTAAIIFMLSKIYQKIWYLLIFYWFQIVAFLIILGI